MTVTNTQLILLSAIVFVAVFAIVYFRKRKSRNEELEATKKLIRPAEDWIAGQSPERVLQPVGAPAEEVAAAGEPKAKPEPRKPADLKDALNNTRASLFGRIKEVFAKSETLSDDEFEALEEVLYTSDLGPMTVQRLVEAVGERMPKDEKRDFEKVRAALKNEMLDIFSELGEVSEIEGFYRKEVAEHKPLIWMIVGVNGVGKTTTIGKLSAQAKALGLKTLVVAGDTFRAAAEDQLRVWTERAGVDIFNPEGVADPSAVAFDGLSMGKSKNYDLVIVDTAGRLHTQGHLMDELKKMKRVMTKVIPDSPHETLLVLDANSGQNALVQAKNFNEALDLTGVVLTKLDGTAKGGVAVGLACELSLPIKLIGIGEGINDLRPFHSKEFVNSIL